MDNSINNTTKSQQLKEILFGGKLEVIDGGFSTGEENMAFDRERADACAQGLTAPLFRIYGWNPWAVSLGANQDENDVQKDECKRRGFDIVRRPTGGRAVLHANELTYSVVMPLPAGMTVHDVYREIHILLLRAFLKLGCEGLEFKKTQPDFRNMYKNPDKSISCFASAARYEIEWKGRKIVGSAQRLFGKTLLQHGSILLGPGHEQLAYLANVKYEEKRGLLLDYIEAHSATLSDVLGRSLSYGECAAAILETMKDYI